MKKNFIHGVISMPSNIFATTGTNVSIIFIDKSKNNDKVLLIDGSKMGEKIKDGKTRTMSGERLWKAIQNKDILDEKERLVMTRRTRAYPVSYESIAEELGLSERAVMVIEENAINSLRVEYFKGNL